MLFCCVFILDYLNIPSFFVQQIPFAILSVVSITLVAVVIVWLVAFRFFDLFKIVSGNPMDAVMVMVCLSALAYSKVRTLILGGSLYTLVATKVCTILFVFVSIRRNA